MKPKYQRAHYARKQLHKNDPGRYCRRNKYVLHHEPDGPIFAVILDEMYGGGGEVKYTASCRHCDTRIEAIMTERNPRWQDLEWRGEFFIIEEEPV